MDCFKEGGIYERVGDKTHLYSCVVSRNLAKIVEYKLCNEFYQPTSNKYFLDYFYDNSASSFKSYMTNPLNFEQVGQLGVNYILDSEKLYPV